MKIPKTVRQYWVYKTVLDKGGRKGNGLLDFRSENGGDVWVVEELRNTRVGKIFAGHLRNSGPRGLPS